MTFDPKIVEQQIDREGRKKELREQYQIRFFHFGI